MLKNIRTGLSPDIVVFCVIVFLADITAGVVSPTFSLFAQGLGASLALLGVLSTVGGVTQMLISLPFGMLSDRIGRSRVLLGGTVTFALALLVMASARGLPLLIVSRILLGIASIATFQIGAAHLGDITTPTQRPFAFGLSTTAMGLGFTIGPVLGSELAQYEGSRIAYVAGAAIAMVSVLVAWRVHRRQPSLSPTRAPSNGAQNVRNILTHGHLMLVSFGNLLMSFAFMGAITTYFPIYGARVGLSQALIGSMFAIRALVSTLGRLPNGIISRTFGNQSVMLVALGIDLMVMFGIAHTSSAVMLSLLLGVDGLAYGAYLVSGQTFVADHTTVENRGAAVGVYSTASSIGATVGPLSLGLVAASWGVPRVFVVTGGALTLGLVVSIIQTVALRQRFSVENGRSVNVASADMNVTQMIGCLRSEGDDGVVAKRNVDTRPQ